MALGVRRTWKPQRAGGEPARHADLRGALACGAGEGIRGRGLLSIQMSELEALRGPSLPVL